MGNVIDIESMKPHVNVYAKDGTAHTLSISKLRRFANNEIDSDEFDCFDEVTRLIVSEWLDMMGA